MQCYYLSLDNLVLFYNALASSSATSSSPFWARTWAIGRFSFRDVWMLSVTTFAVFIASSQASILSQALSFSTLDIAGQWSWSKKQSLGNLHGLHLFLDGVHVGNKRGPSAATLLRKILPPKSACSQPESFLRSSSSTGWLQISCYRRKQHPVFHLRLWICGIRIV